MWSIGIKSGIITVLGLILYGLAVQMIGLQYPLQGSLEYLVLALGIYSGHYYYKAAHQGLLTYKEGLKLGLIVVAFTGLLNGLLVYLYARDQGLIFIKQLTSKVQEALQQMGTDENSLEEIVQLLQQHATPGLLLLGTLFSTILLGFILTLVIATFSRNSKATPSA